MPSPLLQRVKKNLVWKAIRGELLADACLIGLSVGFLAGVGYVILIVSLLP